MTELKEVEPLKEHPTRKDVSVVVNFWATEGSPSLKRQSKKVKEATSILKEK